MLTKGTVCRLDRRRLEHLFRRYPVLERRFLELCVKELAASQDHILALGRFSAEERVAGFIISLVEAQERRGRAGPVFDLPATRADIGEFLGLTLETVSRAISAFRKRGWIRLHGHSGIEITDRRALMGLGSGEGVHAA
jgi:CRP/FNR family transcriptional regulator